MSTVGDLDRAIELNRIIEELRSIGEVRRLRLKEKLALMNSWDELKRIVLSPAKPEAG